MNQLIRPALDTMSRGEFVPAALSGHRGRPDPRPVRAPLAHIPGRTQRRHRSPLPGGPPAQPGPQPKEADVECSTHPPPTSVVEGPEQRPWTKGVGEMNKILRGPILAVALAAVVVGPALATAGAGFHQTIQIGATVDGRIHAEEFGDQAGLEGPGRLRDRDTRDRPTGNVRLAHASGCRHRQRCLRQRDLLRRGVQRHGPRRRLGVRRVGRRPGTRPQPERDDPGHGQCHLHRPGREHRMPSLRITRTIRAAPSRNHGARGPASRRCLG